MTRTPPGVSVILNLIQDLVAADEMLNRVQDDGCS